MSYCRNTGTNSDVYVFGSDHALECCGCSQYKYSFATLRYSRMIKHLEYHQKIGDKVPARALDQLRAEQKTRGDLYQVTNKRKFYNIRKTKNELLERKLWRALEPHRKKLTATTLAVFEKIYGRKPHQLELDGLAKTVSIELDLFFTDLGGKK